MEISVPAPQPFETGRRKAGGVTPRLGQTGNAQWTALFGPIANEMGTFTRETEPFDPNSVDRVESYIDDNAMSNEDKRYLRRNGIGNEANFNLTLQAIKKKHVDRDVLARSSGAALMVTDPANILTLSFPLLGKVMAVGARGLAQSSAYGRIALQEFGKDAMQFPAKPVVAPAMDLSANRVNALRQIVRAKQTVTGQPLTAVQLSKIGALDAAIADGSINLTRALAELDISDDPAQVLYDAALITGATTAMGGAIGYGLGAAMGAPLNRAARMQAFKENYSNFVQHVSKDPPKSESELRYAGKWFTESPLMKFAPTPVRREIQALEIPDTEKFELLSLAGDNGFLFEANRAGKSIGTSVYIEAGRRDGDWFKAVDVIDEAYRLESPRGLSQPLGMPITQAVETGRKKLGMDSFSPQDWYEQIGDLYVRQVPYDDMNPNQAMAVQAVEKFFQKYEAELKEVGLINSRDIMYEGFTKGISREADITSVTESIVTSNRQFMERGVSRIDDQNAKQQAILDDLSAKEKTRGLTDKQIALRKKIQDEMEDRNFTKSVLLEKINLIDDADNIDDLFKIFNSLDLTAPQRKGLIKLKDSLDKTRKIIDGYKEALDARAKGLPSGKKRHLPRFYNRQLINQEREEFVGILTQYYKDNPSKFEVQQDGSVKKVTYPTDPDSLRKRANKTVDNILELNDEDMVDAIFTGLGKSSPLMSRRLDIPSELISKFIITDVKAVMIAYTSRVAPKIEFHRRVRNPDTGKLTSLDNHLKFMTQRMKAKNVPEASINRFIKNYVALYDQIVGTNRKRVDAIDTKIADGLTQATQLTFLGGAGLAALGDIAALFMDHELKTIGKAALSLADGMGLSMSRRELNLAGEALELSKNMAQVRYQESLSNDLFNNNFGNKATSAFFMLNGLGPATVIIKSMDGLLRGHTLIEASQRVLANKASKFEKEMLARYNISQSMMRKFGAMPTEKTQNGLILANTEAWTDQAAVEAFRNALRSGVMNRVIMGTPADKPIMMGGVAYIPEGLARTLPFDLPIDPRVPGYRRVESGLLALPFTFYSYTLGALSKITANYATGAVRNKAAHTAVAMGLGAAIVKARTPSWAWDDMDTEDKIMRAFDFSGLAAIYTDMTYRSLAMINDLGFESNFPIQPRFSAGPDALGAAVSLGGAPADYAYNIASGLGEMLSGNYGEGAKDLIKNAPFISAMAFGGVIEDSAIGIVGALPNRP